ncbi:nucleotidyltransferase domain-containing protein [Candidatus Pacearchaeota archaeon]|nr:nucleotidyltransferase domain-containing protein [Candidatus Pacearchaeota archaeon]
MAAEDSKNEIPEMNIDKKYSHASTIPNLTDAQKETEKMKKEFEKFKNSAMKKFPFTQALGILPAQSIKLFIEEEEAPKETEKFIHLYMIVPEEKLKEIPKIKQELVKELEAIKQKTWLHIKTPVDVWEMCLDSKFELTAAVAMSFPLYDKGILGALRVAEIHKSLVLQKFERYVVSYVLGGSLVRDETISTSDVDVFIIINDTDVKRMPRLELKERLRSIIHQYIGEATALAGTKSNLSPQIYLLTDFWESVKDAHPVIFTFIRDGVPIYDRGTFMPWKVLLKMGKLKPSPEAIDMFMRTAERTKETVDRRLIDAMIDIYYGVLTPSQALLMLYGLPPPTPKETAKRFEEVFVEKEKMLKKSEIAILERAVKEFKAYEHDLKYTIPGKEIDVMRKESEDFLKRLKDLREKIEKRVQEKTIEQMYEDTFKILETILGKNPEAKMIKEFEEKLVKTGKLSHNSLRILHNLVAEKKEFKKGKSNSHKINETRKNASILINELIEYSQRKDLAALEKSRMRLKYSIGGKERFAELIISNGKSFLINGNVIKKITNKVENSDMKELSESVETQKSQKGMQISPHVFDLLKKELGEFEIVL